MITVFLDRDGVINENRSDFVKTLEEFVLLPGAAAAINRLNCAGCKVIVVSNQSCVGRGIITAEELDAVTVHMKTELGKEGAHVDQVYYCVHAPDAGCTCRKPSPGLLEKAATEDDEISLEACWLVGDAERDIQAAHAVGCKAILVRTGRPFVESGLQEKPEQVVEDLNKAVDVILERL